MINQNKPAYIFFYLQPEEKEIIKDISKKLSLSLSAFCRSAILKKATEERIILQQLKTEEKSQ